MIVLFALKLKCRRHLAIAVMGAVRWRRADRAEKHASLHAKAMDEKPTAQICGRWPDGKACMPTPVSEWPTIRLEPHLSFPTTLFVDPEIREHMLEMQTIRPVENGSPAGISALW